MHVTSALRVKRGHAQVRKPFNPFGTPPSNQPSLTDVVDGSSAELPVELLGPEGSEVVDGVGPKVEDVVPGERVPFLDDHHLGPQQGQLDGRPQATGAPPDDEAL